MNTTVKNILIVILALVVGSVVNMCIIMISGSVIPPPNGADVTTMEGLKASMHLFQPKHFIMPFLAHSIGTFVSAFLAAKMVSNHKMRAAIIVGFVFLVGGITNVLMLPSPLWYSILDVVGAYIPMAYLAATLAIKKENV
jgi:hypothetical protein